MKFFKDELENLKKNSLVRQTFYIENRDGIYIFINGKKYLDLSSNDYLGLANHPDIKKASIAAIERFGTGVTSSRLLSGNYIFHTELENKIASLKNRESALVFNSGYQANIGLFSALMAEGDVVFADKLVHASIIDGLKLSGVKFFRFKHNDIDHLESLLKKSRGSFRRALVVTETVFSMDGDIAPLDEIVALKDKYNFEIMTDEAHAIGIKTPKEVDYILGTFSKTFGSFGAYFACPRIVRDYLINKCRSFIFSTALPMSVIFANIKAIDVYKTEQFRFEKLRENTKYFRDALAKNGFEILGQTQIVPVFVGKEKSAVEMAENLRNANFWVLPIRYPTVPKNQARLRFSLTANHDIDVLRDVADVLL